MSTPSDSESVAARELQPIIADTETITQSDAAQPESGEIAPTQADLLLSSLRERNELAAELDAARNKFQALERSKVEAMAAADKRLHQIRSEYGSRVIQLDDDLSAERKINEKLSTKIQGQEQLLADHAKELLKMKEQLSEPAAELQKAKVEFDELQRRYQSLESEAAGLRRERDELQSKQLLSKTAEQQAQSQKAELATQLERASGELRSLRTQAEENEAARKKLMTDLDKEREANKVSRQKTEELNTQLQKLQQATGQAEERARESAVQSKDWEKKAADLKKTVDELTRSRAAEQSAAAQSAQRIKELEQQLKRASDDLAAGRKDLEKQNSTRQRLEAENRNLAEANTRAKVDLEKERDANKISRQKVEDLNTQLQKSKQAMEQAETRARESAVRCADWEKKAADLKKTVDELTRSRAAEQTAAAQSSQRVKELEQQLKRAGDDLAASRTELEKQNSARQRLETENRNLTEANTRARADLDKERDTNKLSLQKAEELNAQFQKLQHATAQAEQRARESAAQSKDWETKAADLKKTVDELNRVHAAEQSAAAQSAQRVKELEQQLKRASDELAASRTELEKRNSATQPLEAENRNLTEGNAKARADLAESVKSQAALQKRASELEQRVHEGVSSLAKMTSELQSERAERERAEKCASAAAAHLQQINEKINRQLEVERASRTQIAELEKIIHDRGDDLARASAALRKETKERNMAQKQLRLVSEMGPRLESNLASLEEAQKTFEVSLKQKDERLQIVERSLAGANSGLEKELAESRRLGGLLAEAQRQLEKLSGESKVEISKLRAALELGEMQRKRMEGELLRSRDVAKNAQHGHAVTLDDLRRELRQPVEDLRQSACRLLESQVTAEQKRAIDTVLEKALFLQVSLNATAQPESASHSQATARRADSRNKKSESK
jgi:chromosome segregation ATPase